MYNIIITSSAEKDLRRLTSVVKSKLTSAILTLQTEPRPVGCLKVRSEAGVWRIGVGDYRIGYTIDDEDQVVIIVRVGHRSDFYE